MHMVPEPRGNTGYVGALDVGSNTIRVLIARVEGGRIVPVLDRSVFARLGLDVDTTHRLRQDRMDEAYEAIREFSQVARTYGVENLPAVATSAIRDAANGHEFVDRVRQDLGVTVEIISGEREAELTFLGASSNSPSEGDIAVVDLGGGSTEIVLGSDGTPRDGASLQFGAGRLTERHIHGDPPSSQDIENIQDYVKRTVEERFPGVRPRAVLLTGGTASNIAHIGALTGDPRMVTHSDMDRVLGILASTRSDEVAARYDVYPERARVLPAGTAALSAILRLFDAPFSAITFAGLREGIIIDRLQGSREGTDRDSDRSASQT